MKYFELTKEENQLLEDFDADKLVGLPDLEKAKKRYRDYAKSSLNKIRNINIRLPERDLYRLKSRAVTVGIPYQTLAASVLHRFAAEEKPAVL